MNDELNVNYFKDTPDYWYNCKGCGGLLKFRLVGWMRVKFVQNNVRGGYEVYCKDCGTRNGWIPFHPNRKQPPPEANPLFD